LCPETAIAAEQNETGSASFWMRREPIVGL